jgi:DNA-binding PadR family transcriptional regulator
MLLRVSIVKISRGKEMAMAKSQQDDALDTVIGRMGEISWLFLYVLHPTEGKPAIRILLDAEDLLKEAHREREIDPSTLHYALKRMEQDGLVQQAGQEQVTVPGGRGGSRREMRTVYVITQLGQEALRRHALLNRAALSRNPILSSLAQFALQGVRT